MLTVMEYLPALVGYRHGRNLNSQRRQVSYQLKTQFRLARLTFQPLVSLRWGTNPENRLLMTTTFYPMKLREPC